MRLHELAEEVRLIESPFAEFSNSGATLSSPRDAAEAIGRGAAQMRRRLRRSA
jgi:hypothetical protein